MTKNTARLISERVVRYRLGDFVGTYTADTAADAEAFRDSPARWAEDRDFAVSKWRAKS